MKHFVVVNIKRRLILTNNGTAKIGEYPKETLHTTYRDANAIARELGAGWSAVIDSHTKHPEVVQAWYDKCLLDESTLVTRNAIALVFWNSQKFDKSSAIGDNYSALGTKQQRQITDIINNSL